MICGFLNPSQIASLYTGWKPTFDYQGLTPSKSVEIAKNIFDYCAPRESNRRFMCTAILPAVIRTAGIATVAYCGFTYVLIPIGHFVTIQNKSPVRDYLANEYPIFDSLCVGVIGGVALGSSALVALGAYRTLKFYYSATSNYCSDWRNSWHQEELKAVELEAVIIDKER